LLKKFSWSEVKSQGYSDNKCTSAVEAYISTEWRRRSLISSNNINNCRKTGSSWLV